MIKWIAIAAGLGVAGYLAYSYLEKSKLDMYAQAKADAPDVIAKSIGKSVAEVADMSPEQIKTAMDKADAAAKAQGSPIVPSDAVKQATDLAASMGVGVPAVKTGGYVQQPGMNVQPIGWKTFKGNSVVRRLRPEVGGWVR